LGVDGLLRKKPPVGSCPEKIPETYLPHTLALTRN